MTGAEIAILVVFLFIIVAQVGAICFLLFYKRNKAKVVATKASQTSKQYKNPALISAVKAVAVLVCICLVCIALLALCNDLLYVTPGERFKRVVAKAYDFDSSVEFEELTLNNEFKVNADYGEITEVHKALDDSAYVITAKGTKGAFNSGSVTILVVVSNNAKDPTILGWALQENDKQTFISNIPASVQGHTAGTSWFVGESITEVQATVTPQTGAGKGTGATYSENAIANAVNMASFYCLNALGLGENPEGDARTAVMELLGDGFDGYTLSKVAFDDIGYGEDVPYASKVNDGELTLSFVFSANGANGAVVAYVFGEGEDIKVIVTVNGAVTATSQNVQETDAIYANVVAYPVFVDTQAVGGSNIPTILLVENTDDGAIYYVRCRSTFTPTDYQLKITVKNQDGKGVVEAIDVITNGFAPFGPAEEDANKLLTTLVGATSATVDSTFESGKVTSATESAKLITSCVKAALSHFDADHAN